jgi:hypothetical protein
MRKPRATSLAKSSWDKPEATTERVDCRGLGRRSISSATGTGPTTGWALAGAATCAVGVRAVALDWLGVC